MMICNSSPDKIPVPGNENKTSTIRGLTQFHTESSVAVVVVLVSAVQCIASGAGSEIETGAHVPVVELPCITTVDCRTLPCATMAVVSVES